MPVSIAQKKMERKLGKTEVARRQKNFNNKLKRLGVEGMVQEKKNEEYEAKRKASIEYDRRAEKAIDQSLRGSVLAFAMPDVSQDDWDRIFKPRRKK